MIERGLARRYAMALFRAALKKDIAGRIQEDINSFQALIEDDPSFVGFLLSPQVLTKDKVTLIRKALDRRTEELFVDFLLLLIEKKRFDRVEVIFEAYTTIYEDHCGIVNAKIVTAVPIDETHEAAVLEKLKSETNKEIRLTKITNPDIVGGCVVFLGDKIIDGSVKFQLESIRKTLKLTKVY